ncbi:MAG: thermonuclease family protein [Nitrosarchaeum sp.]|uniref:thermonuclease family protein n=1 Tax=Nitrosarchaeum sp. TaxID=2026886 RepID=UPI002DF1822D|nr:thermonuclease family protein [Nitrosarchaeum sp.]
MNFIILGITLMIILGILAVFLYYESAQNIEKIKVQIPISGVTEIISEKLQIDSKTTPSPLVESSSPKCTGNADCFSGKVVKIIDGDTIRVDSRSIRFALVSAPEINTLEGKIAKDFVASICPVGSSVLVDEDDGQSEGSYGRMLAVVYCNNVNLNEKILESGNAKISTLFCSESEFSDEPWAKKFGCIG